MAMGIKRILLTLSPEEYLREYGSDILEDPRFLELKKYVQHRRSNAYDHSVNVALMALRIAKEQAIKVNPSSLVRGCLLHDYWGYDCHAKGHPRFHLIRHGNFAAKHSMADFGINPIEEDMIANHMWPLHPLRFPVCIEGWILINADKRVSWHERFDKAKATASQSQ